MLAKIAPLTNEFTGMARYLVRGKSKEPDPKRVAWIAAQNLPTEDPELAAAYMEATAERSVRARKAAYHLMIAWHARERPAPEVMQDVAFKTLALAGLGEHQALIMGHGDKPHPHLHILLNRVHPDTGRAWKPAHDYATFDRIMRVLADAHGFEYAPAHAYNPEITDTSSKGPNSRAMRAAMRGAPTSRPQWSRKATREMGDALSDEIAQCAGFEDVCALLERHGLVLEAKGSGHVIGNGAGYAKLSALNLEASPRVLERVRASVLPMPKVVRRHLFEVDGVDITRAMVTLGLADREDVVASVQERRLARALEAQRRTSRSSTCLASLGLEVGRPRRPSPRIRDHGVRADPLRRARAPSGR